MIQSRLCNKVSSFLAFAEIFSGKSYLLNVLETKPQRAIKLIGTNELEINIEFARALDYREEPEHYDPLALPGQKFKPKRHVCYKQRS